MEKTNVTERKSKTQKILETGAILKVWPFNTGAWALSVSPISTIDKIRFNFFKKGKHGEGFSVYMDGMAFWNLMASLRKYDLRMSNKFEYRTGEKGSRSITVENGSSACLAIHGFGGSKEQSATIGVSRPDAEQMLALWNLFYKTEFENIWKMSYEIGKTGRLSEKDEREAEEDVEYPEEAVNSQAIVVTFGKDIQKRGNFNTVPVILDNDPALLWIPEDMPLTFNPGETKKIYAEQKGSNLKYLKDA